MQIKAKTKSEAWDKAEVIYGKEFGENNTIQVPGARGYSSDDPEDDGYICEYEDMLEVVLANGDSIEILIEDEIEKREYDELAQTIKGLRAEIIALNKENTELSSKLIDYSRTKEQNKTLRRMLTTYSKVADDVLAYIDAIVEFREFLNKVKNLSNHIGTED